MSENRLLFSNVKLDDSLPGYTLPITTTRCIMSAIATKDYYPVHHDPDFARKNGAPNIFINTQTYQLLFTRLVGNWIYPEGRICKLNMRMKSMVAAGDTISVGGKVTNIDSELRQVECELWIENQHNKITTVGKALIELPST